MVHVRRVVGVARTDRPLALVVPLQHERGVAVGPRTEEEFFGPALGALGRRAHAALRAGREQQRAHAGHAVVDAHAVLQVVQRVVFVFQFRKGLLRVHLVVQDHGEFAECRLATLAVDQVALEPVGAAHALLLVAHDQRVEVAVDDLAAVEQCEHRRAVAALLVVDTSVRVLVASGLGEHALHLVVSELRAIPLGASRLDVDRSEQAQADLAAIAFAADRCAHRMGEVGAFAARDPARHRHTARWHQRAGQVALPCGRRSGVVEHRLR